MTERASGTERRFSRVVFHRPATVDVRGVHSVGEVADISLKGALVEIRDGPAPGRGQTVTLTVHLGGDAVIRMDGEVVHAAGPRIGISCDEIDLDSMVHLRRLVEVNTGDEALLHRELACLVAERSW